MDSTAAGQLHFSVQDEGRGVVALYLHPIHPRDLTMALEPFARGAQMAVLSPLPAPEGYLSLGAYGGGWLGPAEAILGLHEPVEVVVLGAGPVPTEVLSMLPSALLAAPADALPLGLGARFALIMEGEGHAVVLSRQRSVLMSVVKHLLGQLVGQPVELRAGEQALSDLVNPVPPGVYCTATLNTRTTYRDLEFHTRNSEDNNAIIRHQRWVHRGGEAVWRAGWSW